MDKKDFKYEVKMILKIYMLMIFAMIAPVLLVIATISGIINGNIIQYILDMINFIFAIFFMLLGMMCGVVGVAYLLQLARRKRESVVSEEYIRELPSNMPPAIASILLDNSIEITTDYTATIAYLISKKIIKINDETEAVIVLKEQDVQMMSHERYVFDCLINKKEFDHEEFKKIIVDDAKEKGVIKEGKRKTHFLRNFIIAIIVFMSLAAISNETTNPIIQNILGILGFISAISIFGVIGYSIFILSKYSTESYHKTKLGNTEAKKWAGVKKYIKDYTLLSNRSLKEIELFESYIPYAISLNEAKEIEKYIEQNEKYRKLIYKKRT